MVCSGFYGTACELNLRGTTYSKGGANMGMARGDKKKLLVVASALAATLSVLPASADPSPYDWAAALPRCDTSRPAVAHHADQQVLASQPTDGPVPCGMLTGWPTVETMIEVTNENAVI